MHDKPVPLHWINYYECNWSVRWPSARRRRRGRLLLRDQQTTPIEVKRFESTIHFRLSLEWTALLTPGQGRKPVIN
ncbi:hypothetical protein KIN20_022341 [Parelaphostrongylus tenuis]|uniref:Uncharacterized protein n=1 Tax=Parelaphostrongylus tenuis TaxID=148309 RepID=A0AAD5MQ84_PARTN|nr:hypothetical protein KIN20_022341 [Parelaphostrongylus tenuis]